MIAVKNKSAAKLQKHSTIFHTVTEEAILHNPNSMGKLHLQSLTKG